MYEEFEVINIIVKFDLEGRHRWPNAPDEFKVLRNEHGHIFHFECYIPVTESRQLEFLKVRRELVNALKKSYGSEPCDFRGMSCEQLAGSLERTISNLYDLRGVSARVIVMEDSFVGAEVTDGDQD